MKNFQVSDLGKNDDLFVVTTKFLDSIIFLISKVPARYFSEHIS